MRAIGRTPAMPRAINREDKSSLGWLERLVPEPAV